MAQQPSKRKEHAMTQPHIFELMSIDAKAPTSSIWTAKDGTSCHISALGNDHLLNIVRMLRRAAKRYVNKTVSAYLTMPYPQGEMAQLSWENEYSFWSGELDNELQTSPENEVLKRLPWWDALYDEMVKRQLTEKPA
jgi:hypothetical protein